MSSSSPTCIKQHFEDLSRFAIWYLYATSAIIKTEKKEFDEHNYHSDMKIFDIKA